MVSRMRKFQIFYTAFKGTKYAQTSAVTPVIKARDIGSAVRKFDKMRFRRKSDIFKIREVL